MWLFQPTAHKTAWRGKVRTISIGPKAQDVVRGFFTPDPADYLFSPIRAVDEVHAARSANRKTPRYVSHMRRNETKRVKTPNRGPTAAYDASSYGHAIARSCDKAFPPLGELAPWPKESRAKWWARLTSDQRAEVKRWRKGHRWHPNQLRHTFATRVRKQHGLEAAQVLLGHARADVTQVYAEKNQQLAAAVAAQVG